MSISETIPPQLPMTPGLGNIGTISASIPFDYSISTENSMADNESTSSNGSIHNQSSQGMDDDSLGVPNSKNSCKFSDIEMVQLQNMNNAPEDEKIRDKNLCSNSKDDDNMSISKADDSVQLEVIPQANSLVPRVRSSSFEEIYNSEDKTDTIPDLPPHIQVFLYRNKQQRARRKVQQENLENNLDSGNSELSSSEPDLKSNKIGLSKPSLSKLRSKFQRSKSVPVLNVVLENDENELESSSPLDSSCDSLDERTQTSSKLKNPTPIKRMFTKNKRPSIHHSVIIAQHRKRVSFASNDDVNLFDTDSTVKQNENSTVLTDTDSNKMENEERSKLSSSSYSSYFSDPSIVTVDENDENDVYKGGDGSGMKTTIKITKKSHFRGGQFCTLLHKFTTVLPRDEIAEKPVVIKDATDVLPLDTGEAIVTDILSNKMVLFDEQGYPKITFAMENGSEPWSAVITPDNGSMAVTLKGDGSVCLWSPKGVSQTDFGQGILSSPTGIHFDRLGRFVISDEGKNSVFLFSRTGNFIGEFVNEDCLNPFAGNKTMESFNQPRYICVSRDGLYFVSDSSNQVVKIFDETGNILRVVGSYGREDGQFRFPYGVAFDEDTKLLYVADHYNHRVSVFSLTGTFLYHILTQADGITRPKGIAICNSKLYVTFGNMRAGNVSVYRIHANRDGGS